MEQAPSQTRLHTIHITWTGFASLISSFHIPLQYSGLPFKAPSIWTCLTPSSLLWCGTLGDDIHVNGPADKGLFTRAGLNPSPYWPTDMQVGRAEKGGLVFLAFSPLCCFCRRLAGIVSWMVSEPRLDSRTMKSASVGQVLLCSRDCSGLRWTNVLPVGSNGQFLSLVRPNVPFALWLHANTVWVNSVDGGCIEVGLEVLTFETY